VPYKATGKAVNEVPAGHSHAVIAANIGAAMGKLLKAPVILERLAKEGIGPQALSPEGFDRLLRANVEKMAHAVKAGPRGQGWPTRARPRAPRLTEAHRHRLAVRAPQCTTREHARTMPVRGGIAP
jgi:hypothetical protein